MSYMFYGAEVFNQNLSKWCVPTFVDRFNRPEQPAKFDEGAVAWTKARPPWGTCP